MASRIGADETETGCRSFLINERMAFGINVP